MAAGKLPTGRRRPAIWQVAREAGCAAPAALIGSGKEMPAQGYRVQDIHYERPTTIEAAMAALAKPGARALAGGTDLIPQLKEGRRSHSQIVDLKAVPELTAITQKPDGGWRIGGAVAVRQLGRHTGLERDHAALIEAAELIGSVQVQSRASLGGNICNAAPSADAVPMLISLGAHAIVVGAGGQRTLPLADLFTGPGRTTLAPGDVLLAIDLPAKAARSGAKYLRFTPRREMDIAIAGAGVRIDLDAAGTIQSAAVTLASVAPVPLVAVDAARSLVGQTPSAALFAEAGRIAAREARPISDTRGSADYRRELVAVLTARALTAAAQSLGVSLS